MSTAVSATVRAWFLSAALVVVRLVSAFAFGAVPLLLLLLVCVAIKFEIPSVCGFLPGGKFASVTNIRSLRTHVLKPVGAPGYWALRAIAKPRSPAAAAIG